jgi:hypothetical protein
LTNIDKCHTLLSIIYSFSFTEKDCNAWNLTLWGGTEQSAKNDYSQNVIGFLCPVQGRQEVNIPEDMEVAHIRYGSKLFSSDSAK